MKRVTDDFGADIPSRCRPAQFETSAEWVERAAAASVTDEDEAMEVKSSAYEVVRSADCGKVDTKKLKRAGDMTEPCGTPVRIWVECEVEWW